MEYIQPVSLSGAKRTWFKNVLHFTDDDYNLLLDFTRCTHKSMMFCPVWSDIDVYYSSISSERESTAIELLRLDSSQLFSEDLPDETLRSALRSRLYLCRESWRDGQRRLRKRAAADISSGQREEAGELSEPAKGESSTSHLVQQSHSMPPLKIALKLPNSQREMVRLSAGQDVDCTGDTSYIDRLEASMNTLSWSSEYGQLDPWSLNPTRPPTSETELKEPDSNGNRSLIHPTDKLTVSSMGPPTSFSANPAEDSEISVVDRPSQRKSGSANIHDEDTITVDVEGRKGMMLAEHARKTSFMKRQRAFSSSQNAKRRRMYDNQETEARPRPDQSTTPNEHATTLPHAHSISTTHAYPSLAQLVTKSMDVPMLVGSTLPKGYATWIPDCEDAGSDRQEPPHEEAMKPYSPAPRSLSPNPALDLILSQLQDLPTPPASTHAHSVDREVHAEQDYVPSVGENDAVSGRKTSTTRTGAAERGNNLRGELEDARAKVIQLEAKVKLVEEAQKPDTLKIETLSTELRLALKNNDALRKDKWAQDQALVSQRQETEQAVSRAHDLRLELGNERVLLKQSNARATTLQDKFQGLERKHQSVNKSFGKAQVSLASQAEEFQQLSASAQSQQHAIQALQAKVNTLQKNLEGERERHQQFMRDLEEKTRSLEQSEQANGQFQARITSLEESLSKSQADLDTQKQEHKEEHARWGLSMNSLRSHIMSRRISGPESDANQNLTAISSTKQDAKNMAKQNANLQAQLDIATNKAEKSENAVRTLAGRYDALILQQDTTSLEYKDSIQLANKLIIRWQRFFADLVYVLFTLTEEDFSSRRLGEIMRQQRIGRKIVREIKVRGPQWEPFVAAALQDRCMDVSTTYLAKMMDQRLPESAAEVLAQFDEAGW